MTETMRFGPIDIVELAEKITLHVRPSDQARCLRVSRAWYEAFLPRVYFEVELDERGIDRILRHQYYLQALARHGHLVRRVTQPLLFGTTAYASALKKLGQVVIEHCTHLTHLSYCGLPLPLDKILGQLMKANVSTLSTLSIAFSGTQQSMQVSTFFAIPETPDQESQGPQGFLPFRQLVSLNLSLEGYPSFHFLVFILQRCPRLLHLELQKCSRGEIVVLPESLEKTISTSPEALTFRLQSLTVKEPGQCSAIPKLLQHCPCLTSLVLPPFPEELHADLCVVLRKSFDSSSTSPPPLAAAAATATNFPSMLPGRYDMHRITSLTLARSDKFTDKYLVSVLRCFPLNQLQFLDFMHTGAGGATMSVILDTQLACLDTLRLSSTLHGITNGHMLTLLTKGTQLRVLELAAEISHNTHFYIENLIQQPWACLDLEVFCVGIDGVCDPNRETLRFMKLRDDHVQQYQEQQKQQEQQEQQEQARLASLSSSSSSPPLTPPYPESLLTPSHEFQKLLHESLLLLEKQILEQARAQEQVDHDMAAQIGCKVYQVETESRFYGQLAKLHRLREINTWCRGCARPSSGSANQLAWELQLQMPQMPNTTTTEAAHGMPSVLPGIEALSTLTQLRGFKPGFVRRHFSVPEVQWMKAHWKRLDQLSYKVVVPTSVLPPTHWLGAHWPTLHFYPSLCI